MGTGKTRFIASVKGLRWGYTFIALHCKKKKRKKALYVKNFYCGFFVDVIIPREIGIREE